MKNIKMETENKEKVFYGDKKDLQKERLNQYDDVLNAVLDKNNQIEALSEYSDVVYGTITKYNDSINNTMMIKGLRKTDAHTKNRESHQKDVVKVATRIARGINQALGYKAINTKIVATISRNHDIAHTFLGHSGEWWISNIKEDYGIGYYCHNALGARDLIYHRKIYDEIIEKIQQKEPTISDQKLSRIKDSLWLIMEGINSHNGERSESEYMANFSKTEADFEREVLYSHTQKGFDKKIIPATIESTLMRISDKISYIPYDMVDGIREGFIDGLDEEYIENLKRFGITQEDFDGQDYDSIAEKIQDALIQDVIQTTVAKIQTEQKDSKQVVPIQTIKLSDEMAHAMHQLRDINNKQIVDYVVLKEDAAIYPEAIRKLIEDFGGLIAANHLVDKLGNMTETEKEALKASYKGLERYGPFIDFVCDYTKEEAEFTKTMIQEALKQSTEDELAIAREFVLQRKGLEKYPEETFPRKRARLEQYIAYYNNNSLVERLEKNEQTGKLEKRMYITSKKVDANGNIVSSTHPYEQEDIQKDIQRIYEQMQSAKKAHSTYTGVEQGMALEVGARFISQLNDIEFLQMLMDFEMITEEQRRSLRRPYSEINLQEEVYRDPNWEKVAGDQKRQTGIAEKTILG